MYYMPAKGAEPKPALCRLNLAKKHLARALYLIAGRVVRAEEDQQAPQRQGQDGTATLEAAMIVTWPPSATALIAIQ